MAKTNVKSKSRSRTGARKPAKKAKRAAAGSGARSKKATDTTSLLLRDIAPDVLDVLKQRAKHSGRSLQQELHVALRRDAKRNFEEARSLSDAWHTRLQDRDLPDTTDLIREDRDG